MRELVMTAKLRSNAIAIAATVLVCWAAAAPSLEAQVEGDPIDLAIVLDVSGTMKGLIDSTRLNIWEIVNELAEAEPTPSLRVALITYGNQQGSRASGWVRVETGLTNDLDLVSERLFRLRGRGADERVGRALETALEKLDWSDSEHALKLLFIAGNEPADQDPDVRFDWMSEAALDAHIFLSSVFCGSANDPAAATWKQMAELAEGDFAAIDHRARAAVMQSPFDRQLAELGELINETFVPVGKRGKEQQRSRARQDKSSRNLGLAVAATRAQTKAGPLYSSPSDLVSLFQSGELDRSPVERSDLPQALRRMTSEERTAYLEEMQAMRQEIRAQIAELSAARERYLAEHGAAPQESSFDALVRRTIRERAEQFGYSFPQG